MAVNSTQYLQNIGHVNLRSYKSLWLDIHSSGYPTTNIAAGQGDREARVVRWIMIHNRQYLRSNTFDMNTATNAQLLVLRDIQGMPQNLWTQTVIDARCHEILFLRCGTSKVPCQKEWGMLCPTRKVDLYASRAKSLLTDVSEEKLFQNQAILSHFFCQDHLAMCIAHLRFQMCTSQRKLRKQRRNSSTLPRWSNLWDIIFPSILRARH